MNQLLQGKHCIDTGSSTYLVSEPLYPERQGPLKQNEKEREREKSEMKRREYPAYFRVWVDDRVKSHVMQAYLQERKGHLNDRVERERERERRKREKSDESSLFCCIICCSHSCLSSAILVLIQPLIVVISLCGSSL